MKLSVKQAAERIGISTSLMYSLLESRQIRHERHGCGRGKYVISEEAVEEYRRGREVGVAEALAPAGSTLRHITQR